MELGLNSLLLLLLFLWEALCLAFKRTLAADNLLICGQLDRTLVGYGSPKFEVVGLIETLAFSFTLIIIS